MGTVVKLSGKGGPDKESKAPAPKRSSAPSAGGLAAIEVTPLMAAGMVAALLVVVVGLWFAFRQVTQGAAATPLMDTGTETSTSPAWTKANGMETSTDSAGPATTNNGMDTGTGR